MLTLEGLRDHLTKLIAEGAAGDEPVLWQIIQREHLEPEPSNMTDELWDQFVNDYENTYASCASKLAREIFDENINDVYAFLARMMQHDER